MSSRSWAAARDIIADRDGPYCHYCRVPTAATVEHLHPRSKDGEHGLRNTVLACPYCNATRGNEDLLSWRGRRGWKIDPPAVKDYEELLAYYPKSVHGQYLYTGNTNSRVKIQDGRAIIQVRSGRGYEWRQVWTGSTSNPQHLIALWLFMRRHNAK
jgi:hypothetical protein